MIEIAAAITILAGAACVLLNAIALLLLCQDFDRVSGAVDVRIQ